MAEMAEWFGYIGVRRVTANLSAANWAAVIALFDAIVSNHLSAHERLQKRVRLDGNEVLYRCRFAVNAVSFEKCGDKLASAFGVDRGLVTHTTGTLTLKNRLSAFATYRYGGQNRLIVGLFGAESDDILCTRQESRDEAAQYIETDHTAEWNEAI
jgi:hypothetical protein